MCNCHVCNAFVIPFTHQTEHGKKYDLQLFITYEVPHSGRWCWDQCTSACIQSFCFRGKVQDICKCQSPFCKLQPVCFVVPHGFEQQWLFGFCWLHLLNGSFYLQISEKTRKERIAAAVVNALKLFFLLNILNSFHGVWYIFLCKEKQDRAKFLLSMQVSVYLSGVMPVICEVLHSSSLYLEERELTAQSRQNSSQYWTDSAK